MFLTVSRFSAGKKRMQIAAATLLRTCVDDLAHIYLFYVEREQERVSAVKVFIRSAKVLHSRYTFVKALVNAVCLGFMKERSLLITDFIYVQLVCIPTHLPFSSIFLFLWG